MRTRSPIVGLLVVGLLLLFRPLAAAAAQAPTQTAATPAAARERAVYRATRVESPVAIDGKLDEPVWQQAATFELAWETSPADNVPAPVRTEGWVAYDSENLYVAFKAHDPEPSKVRARISDRDRAFQDDFVGVVLDTFNDSNRAFEFFVNPLGVQMDLTQNDVTGNEDDSWDAIWSSSGRITEEGYVVELAVPFSSLRFPAGAAEQTWGLDAVRIYPRDARRRLGLNRLEKNVNCYLCQASSLNGIAGIRAGRSIELDPTATGFRTDQAPAGSTDLSSGDAETEVGLTARWGVTPNLNLSAAINPDFSQVEADVAQLEVNRQFALFYPEKRPFFLEGADYFETRLQAVYSRQIADPEWGVKLSGKVGKGALGVVVTEDRVTNLLLPGSQGSALASLDQENLSTVLRYRYDLGPGSTVGALYTGREGDGYGNRVLGFDSLVRWRESYAFRVEALGSQTEYPDALADAYGQSHDRIEDYALRLALERSTKNWYMGARHEDVGKDFRADLGFIPQADYRRSQVDVERRFYRDGRWKRFWLGGHLRDVQDHDGHPLDRRGEFWFSGQGPRQFFFNSGFGVGDLYYQGETFRNDYFFVFVEQQATSWLYYNFETAWGDEPDYANARAGTTLILRPAVRFDLGRHLRLQVNHAYQSLDVDGGELFTANLTQLRATYQFNVRTFLRVVSTYQDLDRQPTLYRSAVDAQSTELFNQLLFSYKLNPQTVLFLGYSDHHETEPRGPNDRRAPELLQRDRTFFAKIGYALLL